MSRKKRFAQKQNRREAVRLMERDPRTGSEGSSSSTRPKVADFTVKRALRDGLSKRKQLGDELSRVGRSGLRLVKHPRLPLVIFEGVQRICRQQGISEEEWEEGVDAQVLDLPHLFVAEVIGAEVEESERKGKPTQTVSIGLRSEKPGELEDQRRRLEETAKCGEVEAGDEGTLGIAYSQSREVAEESLTIVRSYIPDGSLLVFSEAVLQASNGD